MVPCGVTLLPLLCLLFATTSTTLRCYSCTRDGDSDAINCENGGCEGKFCFQRSVGKRGSDAYWVEKGCAGGGLLGCHKKRIKLPTVGRDRRQQQWDSDGFQDGLECICNSTDHCNSRLDMLNATAAAAKSHLWTNFRQTTLVVAIPLVLLVTMICQYV